MRYFKGNPTRGYVWSWVGVQHQTKFKNTPGMQQPSKRSIFYNALGRLVNQLKMILDNNLQMPLSTK
jgi:hypothetical protein